ncbi:MAG TPA: hypothetical protein PK530_21550, partial [Anaerolineales bacterium]|nr:hypothetical protein [Anaerolineales bacterium]
KLGSHSTGPTLYYDVSSLKRRSLSELAQLCSQETARYIKNESEVPRHCYELFRRAIIEKNEDAWKVIYLQYRSQVRQWVNRHPIFQDFDEDADFFVNLAFEKFWQRNFSASDFARFPNTSSILAYLKTCVVSVLLDYRMAEKQKTFSANMDLFFSEQPPQGPSQEDFWSNIRLTLNDDVAYTVVYSTFVLNMRPNEILSAWPNLFSSVSEVYKIKARALMRLSSKLINEL